MWHFLDVIKDGSRIALPVGIFFLSFLQWWYSDASSVSFCCFFVVGMCVLP